MKTCANCGKKMKMNAPRVVLKDGFLCPNCYQKITGEKIMLLGWKESFKFMKTKISDLQDYEKIKKCANCGDKIKTNEPRVVFKDGLLCPACFTKITGEKITFLGWKESFKFMKTRISDLPDYHGILCPNCGSTHVELVGENRKGFSFGKAAGGALLTGGIGLLAGFAGKKDGTKFFCDACHKTFKIK